MSRQSFYFSTKPFLGAFALSALTACSFSPTSEQAQKFGGATALSLGSFRDAGAAGNEMRLQIAIHQEACRYLAGAPASLAVLSKERASPPLEARIDILDHLVDYANSLVAATNPTLTARLETSASALASSVAKFTDTAGEALTASGTPVTSNPAIAPAVKLISSVLVDLVEYETRTRLRTIIEDMHPKIVLARRVIIFGPRPVGDQFEVIGGRLQDAHGYLVRLAQRTKAARACVLQRVRKGNSDKIGAYRLFVEMDEASRQLDARISLFSDRTRLQRLLDAVVESHFALLSDEVDFVQSMQKIQKILAEIHPIIVASKP